MLALLIIFTNHLGLLYIRNLDDILIIMPNSQLLEMSVKNWSKYSKASRIVLPIRVSYGSDMNKVVSILIEAAKNHSEVLNKPAPKVWFKEFGEDGLNFQLLVWISKPRKQFQIKSDLFFKIDANLRHHNIQVPLPQRSLHIGSGSLPLELSSKLEDSLLQISTAVTNWFNKQAQSNDLKDYTNSSLNNKHKDF